MSKQDSEREAITPAPFEATNVLPPVSDPETPADGEAIVLLSTPALTTMLPRLQALETIAIRRRQAVRAEGNLQRQIKAYVRRRLTKDGEEVGEKITAEHIERYESDTVVIQLSAVSKDIHKWRATEEKLMEKAIEGLPGLESFWRPVRGLGDLGYAQIVAEAGDLSAYATHSKLWRRFGLAPTGGKACSTWKREGGLSAKDWEAAGYCPRRRSLMYVLVDSLLRRKDNAYYALYQQYKADEARKAEAEGLIVASANDIPKGEEASHRSLKHIDMRARRKVAKRLLRDVWRAWQRESGRA